MLARNTIVRRALTFDGKKTYLRMGDGSLIKIETAIRRGYFTREEYEAALAEESRQAALEKAVTEGK